MSNSFFLQGKSTYVFSSLENHFLSHAEHHGVKKMLLLIRSTYQVVLSR